MKFGKSNSGWKLSFSSLVTCCSALLLLLYFFYLVPLVFGPHQKKSEATTQGISKYGSVAGYKTVEVPFASSNVNKLPIGKVARKQMEGNDSPIMREIRPQQSHKISFGNRTIVREDKHLPVGKHIGADILEPTSAIVNPRASYPSPLAFFTKHSRASQATMVVGGTDGSGTRRVVQILSQLGVVMISEDPETYDIHADGVKGWPTVVSPVVNEAKTLNYDPKHLSGPLQSRTEAAVRKILDQVDKDSTKPTSYKLAVGGVLPHPSKAKAKSVKYGFKAPVAMTLAPWFADFSPHFKFVHVLRDGRDISFSANQGPVQKFYNPMYGSQGQKDINSVQIKAIRLWSDWNSQVYHWAQRYTEQVDRRVTRTGADSSFGYLVVHAEDLVSADLAVRHAAITHMADFVGSSLSAEALCCLAQRESEFMGSHDRTTMKQKNATPLAKRFGKWHDKLSRNKPLSDSVHRIGKEGLEIFGYEPLRNLPNNSGMRYQSPIYGECLVTTYSSCAAEEAERKADEARQWGISGRCTMHGGIDYVGGDLEAIKLSTADKTMCCSKCMQHAKCKFYTIDPSSMTCYLKSHHTGTKLNAKLVSGDVTQ